MRNNNRVPIAILSCFLIAFILQGILKLSGVLVFEKALDWEIFNIIDKYDALQIILYSTFNIISVYCLSFTLTGKCYSRKWYHYVIIVLVSYGATAFRMYAKYTQQINILVDIVLYVIVPFIISITTDRDSRLFEKNSLFSIITTLSMNIFLYFGYLGLSYWSNLLNSLLPINTVWLTSSVNFLISFEIYIGLVTLMLSFNIIIKNVKRSFTMNMPMNIASKKAKLDAKLKKLSAKSEKLNKEIAEINKEIAELEAKETAK